MYRSKKTKEKGVESWRDLVQSFSPRKFANRTDKVLALSAMARKLRSNTGAQCVEGMAGHTGTGYVLVLQYRLTALVACQRLEDLPSTVMELGGQGRCRVLDIP
jgi:hypothetical protein